MAHKRLCRALVLCILSAVAYAAAAEGEHGQDSLLLLLLLLERNRALLARLQNKQNKNTLWPHRAVVLEFNIVAWRIVVFDAV